MVKIITKYSSGLLGIVAITLVVYIGVDLFYRIVKAELGRVDFKQGMATEMPEKKRAQRPPLREYRIIKDRNLFGSKEKAPAPPVKVTEIERLEPTSLRLQLLGTVVGDRESSVAVIEEKNKRKQGLYKVGDNIQDALVKMILRGKVVLNVGGKDQILTMEDSSKGKASTKGKPLVQTSGRAGKITVHRSDLQKAMSNVNTLLSQVRIRPYFKDGKPSGLGLSRIKPDSFFSRLGLRDGDIVQGIDNKPIRSPDDILALYQQLKTGSRISLQITRGGRQRTLHYELR
ncbi:MAG: type II secretion system protein GspC [Deltaproteobacteria bacterium]|nr:type II secretion system protein GspC [Deltaproteobacteria bacterium]MBW2065377.1 type II secretion system protein GspC [Deltaproteobacteria bacterium]